MSMLSSREISPPALSLILALVCLQALAQKPSSGIGYDSVTAARKGLQAKPTAMTQEQDGWTIVTDEGGDHFTTWTFAPKSHPAYPAVFRRDVIEKNGQPTLVTHLLCESSRRSCDQLYARMRARIAACHATCTTLLP